MNTVLLSKIAHRNIDKVHPDKRRCNCPAKMSSSMSDHETYCRHFKALSSAWNEAYNTLMEEENETDTD